VTKLSGGLLPWRRRNGRIEVMLVHPGGPFFARKETGVWSIAKGETDPGEDALAAAIREFREETGFEPHGPYVDLGEAKQPGGKIVRAFAFEGDYDTTKLVSNSFELEWPPHSGRTARFPEVDRAAWFDLGEAKRRIVPGQVPLLEALARRLADAPAKEPVALSHEPAADLPEARDSGAPGERARSSTGCSPAAGAGGSSRTWARGRGAGPAGGADD
jgi:predicted NUDIX family NTP pyrophosphohydrolase